MRHNPKAKKLTGVELATAAGVNRNSIVKFRRDGMPGYNARTGKYDATQALPWILERLAENADTDPAGEPGEIRELKARFYRGKCLKIEHKIALATESVHSKADCCRSLTAIISLFSQELNELGRRMQTMHPEVPGLRKTVEQATNDLAERTRRAMDIEPAYKCPACGVSIEQFIVEHRPPQPGETHKEPRP